MVRKISKIQALWTTMGAATVLAVAIAFAGGVYPIVRFEQERIDVRVFPDYTEVEGRYHYRNPLPIPVIQGFSIPFPAGDGLPPPAFLSADLLSPHPASIPCRRMLGRQRFELRFAPGQALQVRIRYQQRAPVQKSRYLLTTTRPWRRPLKRAEYYLWPRGVEILSSSYPLRAAGNGALWFRKTHFMPPRDWTYTWR